MAAALYLCQAVVSSPIIPLAAVNHIEYLSIAATSGCNYRAGCMPSRGSCAPLFGLLTSVAVCANVLTVQGGLMRWFLLYMFEVGTSKNDDACNAGDVILNR
jgi:hypothetical protein